MKEVISGIREHKRFLITAHINLEGDSLGSQLAIKRLLDSLGKASVIVDSDPVPGHLRFLEGSGEVTNKLDKDFKFDAAIILDCPTLKRTGRVAELISKDKFIINIDHHISNEKFGVVNWVDPKASSAGEMIFRLFKEMGVRIDKEAALDLYIAILTDTGSFNYDNTTAGTHEVAAELLKLGIAPASVSGNVYERKSIDEIKFLGSVLSTIKFNVSREIAYLEVTKAMMRKTGSDAAKSEGFVNYARSIDNVKVAAIFREESGGKVNVSFRSKGDVDVNSVAAAFGGGGHVRASGCVIEGTLAEAEKKVLAKIQETLERIKNSKS